MELSRLRELSISNLPEVEYQLSQLSDIEVLKICRELGYRIPLNARKCQKQMMYLEEMIYAYLIKYNAVYSEC